MTLSAYLKNQRELKELKVKDIADRLKVSSSYISQLERGACFPSKKQLVSLAKAYDVKEDELIKRWAEVKIHKVGIDTDYKFDIKSVDNKKVDNVARQLKNSLDEFKKINSQKNTQMEVEFSRVHVLNGLPTKKITNNCQWSREFIALPKIIVPENHTVCAIRILDYKIEEMGMVSGDVIIIDKDAKINNGDIALIETPEGVTVRYYQKRKNIIELKPETKTFKKIYKFKDIRVVGKLIYHIKKY